MSSKDKAGFSKTQLQRFCPKCEEEKTLPESLEETVKVIRNNGLTKEQTVSDELYQKRLKACTECPFLSGKILCTMCGCYVAVRALYSDNECPSPKKDRWINL